MGSNYENVDDAKTKLKEKIDKELAESGVRQGTTCPTGESFGWDMYAHYALEWFLRHTPERWHIGRTYRHECYDWVITEA